MLYFTKPRNCELSLLKYLEDNINTDWTGISTLKTWKQVYTKDIALPIVVASLDDTATTRLEIGSNTIEERFLCIIDIFARSSAQAIDLSYYIKEKLKVGWIHYDCDHASGDSSTVTYTANGRDTVVDWIQDTKVDVGETEDVKDRYRRRLAVRIRNSG